METHQQNVVKIAASVRQFYEKKEGFRINHGSTNSTRPRRHNRVVDIGMLSNVLKVDTESRTALVEPNVPMDRLVEATLNHGLIPPVVMEFPGITTGGGYAGTAGESSSFKYGFFDRTINSVEVVLADGEVITASETENADLFRGAAGAVGTLGITTLIELQLNEAKKFVKTTYTPKSSVADTISLIQEEIKNPQNEYVDAIVFSKTHGVVVTGALADSIPQSAKPQTFNNPSDPWFYLHVQEKTAHSSTQITEYIPLADYLFRYDRGGFWVGASAFSYFKFPFNRLTRWFLDDFLHTRMLYRALHASGESNRYVVQDMALPFANMERFVEWCDGNLGIWPLWLCPLRQGRGPTMHPHTEEVVDGKLGPMLNIGLWGFGPKRSEKFVEMNRLLEGKLRELGGMKWLYAHTYYNRDEFWQQYDRESYEALRKEYRATTLPDVYDKVKVDVEANKKELRESWSLWARSFWPLGGIWGLYKAIRSGDYLVARKSAWRRMGGGRD
ncbi:FAD binding domain-containing protein [Aulographum hederae CBS 113979]|uniref:Delta(24)-sterol reductase n=1 Tax=Aulographum hederae CBS 113979 TaxID=1176131 RepID=A0A6G1GRI6_9PEZI|nr:FAD binding domain-containing protein [Aulographum hederae CBS 113979]